MPSLVTTSAPSGEGEPYAVSVAAPKMAVRNLDLHYRDFHALKGVSLAFPERKVTALIGPSGCGRSTLLKTLNRMNDLVAGCRVEGEVLPTAATSTGAWRATICAAWWAWCSSSPTPFP